ncbi:MAG: hypothetical protein HY913_09590 [Desulfomonile tiedjei]|nr:hypothetical protein [Desulfomonile tiedjei]
MTKTSCPVRAKGSFCQTFYGQSCAGVSQCSTACPFSNEGQKEQKAKPFAESLQKLKFQALKSIVTAVAEANHTPVTVVHATILPVDLHGYSIHPTPCTPLARSSPIILEKQSFLF